VIVHARLAGIEVDAVGPAGDEADAILAAFRRTPLASRLASARVLGREVPILLAEAGAAWRGAIDLVYRDDDGSIVVADFKTDSSDEGALARYGEQVRAYARAVRRALPDERVRAEIWMLRTGRVLSA
jgi:ATP-dependent exoDNAse (exonuclease V) beta subunit